MAAADTVEVIDPTHPLYGQRFPIHSLSHPTHGLGHVFVVYQEQIRLHIPLAATNLAPCPRATHSTKLTLESIRQLLLLVKECTTSCRTDPPPSGNASPQP